jgi:hypothetical protein
VEIESVKELLDIINRSHVSELIISHECITIYDSFVE